MAKEVRDIIINASPKDCYKVIWDFAKYPEFISDLNEVEVTNKKGNACDVTYHIKIIKDITYTLKMKGTPGKKIEWSFVEGDFMKDNNGYWELTEIEKGVTKATYHIEMKFGMLVPGSVTKMLVGKSLPIMLEAVKKRVESN